MISLIALVLGSYVLAALSVHLIRYYGRRHRSNKSQHYVLYARNDASRMEWFLRSIGWFSRRSGTEVRVTVIDCGSSDETLAIVGRFAQNGMGCAVESLPPDRYRELRLSRLERGGERSALGSGAGGKASSKANGNANAKSDQNTDAGAKANASADANANASADAKSNASADAKSNASADAKSNASMKAKADTSANANSNSNANANPNSNLKAKADTNARASSGGHFSHAGDCAKRGHQSIFVDLNRPEDIAKLPLF